MSIDEQSRHRLHSRLEEVLGEPEASTLMGHLPPVGWADVSTKGDLAHLKEQIDARFESMEVRFESMENKLLAAFRREMIVQTRTIIFALMGTVLSMAAIVFFRAG